MIHEVIIVGTGPSGAASALGFAEHGIVPLILDVGKEPSDVTSPDENMYSYRKTHDAFELMIGRNYEMLDHVINKKSPSPKISSPFMQFVIEDADELSPIEEKGSHIIQSFAKGGLASAWGAGLYRFLDDELRDVPIRASDLAPYYDRLTKEIGISGDNDDLTPFFGSTDDLLRPMELSGKAKKLLSMYKKKKRELNARGVFIGKPRLGVLSEDHDGRSAYDYRNLEMWMPNLPYVYTPAFTVRKLVDTEKALYRKSVLVRSWDRKKDHLTVNAEDLDDGSSISFDCKKLVLAAGTVNSSKIVLESKKDYGKKLPFIENSLVQVPLVSTAFVGKELERDSFGLTNLNLVIDRKEDGLRLQGSMIELTSPARALFHEMMPFAARDNLTFIKYLLPAVSILFLYFPGSRETAGDLMLRPDRTLEIKSVPIKVGKGIISEVASVFRSLGAFTHPLIIKPPDHSLHYVGTMPMEEEPRQEYTCDRFGELYNEPDVHIVDGSVLAYVPSKNHSFTLMANAMRIAEHISRIITG